MDNTFTLSGKVSVMLEKDKPIFDKLSALEAMALTIYGEARGEKWDGKLAVGYVILNRSRLWKQSIKEVCYAKNQFSCYLSSDPNYEILLNIAKDFNANLPNNKQLQLCRTCAEMVSSGPTESIIGDATFYKVIGTKNKWFDRQIEKGELVKVCEIGNHEFHKEVH